MSGLLSHGKNWWNNPRRFQPRYIVERLRERLRYRPPEMHHAPLDPPVETGYVSLLHDAVFRRSVVQVKDRTCQDAARLANLWNLVRCVGPGTFLEVGSYRGGTALHICNAIDEFHPGAPFYCFDPFESGGFENLSGIDAMFKPDDFMETHRDEVAELLRGKSYARAVQGFFPAAAETMELGSIAFCHLDVDIYTATRDSLAFLAPRLAPRSIIVLDDLDHRETPGVRLAMEEFLRVRPEFVMLPMFPVQGVLLSKALW